MKNPLMPDYMFRTFDEITPAFLTSLGVKAILADIDNTLAPYEQPEPDERIKGWIASLAEAGIGIAFVSNNDWERVNRFNATLGVPAYAKSGKPFKKNLIKAMNDLGGTLDTTVMLGDQLLTDALAGHNLGVKCITQAIAHKVKAQNGNYDTNTRRTPDIKVVLKNIHIC